MTKNTPEYNRAYFLANQDGRNQQIRARQRRNLVEVRKLKLEIGCEVCGYKKCARAIQFHHKLGTKVRNVAKMVTQGCSMATIKAEIDKCICLCANCHHELHDVEGGSATTLVP